MPYFERPRPPKDWRWRVGLIGRTFITIGLLMFAFVGYQLWGTGIQTAQAQHDLSRQFDGLLQSTSTATSTTSTTSTTSPTSPTSTTSPTSATPTPVPTTTPLPTTPLPTTPTTTTVPVAPSGPPIANGTAIARLKIASIGLDKTIVEGVGVSDLKKGPGHFAETPMPGQLGNAAIAGHRTTYGHPFFDLDQVKVGDLIEVSTVAGTFVYSVTGTTVVSPSQYELVIPTIDPNVATLTLATCTPAYTAKQRLIVKATLVPAQSSQVMAPPWVTSPGTTEAATTLPGDSLPASTTPAATTTPATTTPAAVVPATTVAPPSHSNTSDVFASGWFDDSSAVPHVIIWGLLLLGVCVGAFFIGKRTRRLWVSFATGVLPFVIVLYFFFENVNRLLPSSI